MPKFTISEALLSGRVAPHTVDEIAWLLEGGPANRTAYMAQAARRAAARVEQLAMIDEWAGSVVAAAVAKATDANYPADCGSRWD
jgi:hypothetical protein